MDVTLLSQLLKELILDNDRISLPGIGSFVADIAPAYFSEDGKTINPPFRRIFFRSSESWNDKLIGKYYADKLGVDIETVRDEIDNFFETFRTDLNTKKSIDLPGFGRMRSTKEGNLYFVSDRGLDIYANAYGLEPISLKVLNAPKDEIDKHRIATEMQSEYINEDELTDVFIEMSDPAEAQEERAYLDEYRKKRASEMADIELDTDINSEIETNKVLETDSSVDTVDISKGVDNNKRSNHKTSVVILIVLSSILFILLVIYLLGLFGILDSILYTEEELNLIRSYFL